MADKKKLPDQLGIVPVAADRENTVTVGGKAFPMRKDQAARFKTASAPAPTAPAAVAGPPGGASAMANRGRGGRALFDAAVSGASSLPETTAAIPMDRSSERGTKTQPLGKRKTVVAKTPTRTAIATKAPSGAATFAMTRPTKTPAARITKASVDAQVAHQRQLYAKNHPPRKKTSQHDFSGLKWFR